MPNQVAILFVHGINVADPAFARHMQARLRKALPSECRDCVDFASVYWADIVRDHQRNYMDRVQAKRKISDSALRRLVIEGLGDAAAYQKTLSRGKSAYYKIQERIAQKIEELDTRAHPNRPLVLIGHSLGCHIISSYVWDINTWKQIPEDALSKWNEDTRNFYRKLQQLSEFQRLETVAGIVTMGSNMPLFTFTIGPENIFPITKAPPNRTPGFPGVKLNKKLSEQAKWLNFYSPNDLLGYPLKPLNDGYRQEARISDIEVRAEGFWRSLLPTPFNAVSAHTKYWTCDRVIRDTAKLVQEVIEA